MLIGTGVAIVGAAAGFAGYAAYRPDTGTTASSAPPAGGASSTPGGSQGPELAKLADIPENGGKVLGDQKIVLTRGKGDDVHAFTAVCTHQGCIVANVSGGTINCNCHGSKYDATTGQVVRGPAPQPLAPIAVTVKDGSIVKG